MDITITDYKETPIHGTDPLVQKNVHKPVFVEMVISGMNTQECNLMRQANEKYVKCLQSDFTDIETDDPFMRLKMIIVKRVMMIPIDQSIDINKEFTLEATNTTPVTMDVKTELFKPYLKANNFTIAQLQPGKSITIKCKVIETRSIIDGHGAAVLAYNPAVFPITTDHKLDCSQLTTLATHTRHKFTFKTAGTIEAKKLLLDHCLEIIERFNRVAGTLDSILNKENEYALSIDDETALGGVLARYINDNTKFTAGYSEPNDIRKCVVRITVGPPNLILSRQEVIDELTSVLKSQIKRYEQLAKLIKSL